MFPLLATAGGLRVFFILIGWIGIFSNLSVVSLRSGPEMIFAGVGMVLGAAFLYLGVCLKHLLI